MGVNRGCVFPPNCGCTRGAFPPKNGRGVVVDVKKSVGITLKNPLPVGFFIEVLFISLKFH